jgi:hypothetical protein
VITLVLLPFGLFVVFRNWRRLRALRARVNASFAAAAVLETQLAAVAAGYPAAVAPGVGGDATDRHLDAPFASLQPATFNRYGRHRPWLPVAVGLGLIVAAAAIYLAIDAGALGHKPKPRPRPLPTAPVAVLNAGQTPDAAHHLAVRLARRHVHVVGTGNLGTTPPTTYEVLYAPGEVRQARLLAALLRPQHPLVEPIDAATAQAIGSAPKLVVVIP